MRKTNLSLEGLRGAAAVFVVLFHMHFSLPGLEATRNGYLAVDLFFVLSGFVIANAYSARIDNPNQLTRFIVRRFGRLWPTHMTASVLCYLVPSAIYAALTSMHADIPQPTLPTVGEVLGIVFMTQGLHLYDHDVGTAVSWSSSDEFYVYLMFGVVCLALRNRQRIAAFIALALTGYAIAIWSSLNSQLCIEHRLGLDLTFDYGWARCIAGFFIGALIAEYRGRCWVVAAARTSVQTIAFVAAVLLIMCADLVRGSAFLAPIVFGVLIASLGRDTGPVARLFQTRFAQYLGALSYSLYLGHAIFRPLLSAASNILTSPSAHLVEGTLFLMASFALAYRMNQIVEIPFRRRFNAWSAAAFQAPAPTGTAAD
ncbi:hypothetical protein WJ60_08525 [Burkholderia ubonensis]|uniref:acyltransferase family protein n=1 Tax=Burkholderia ubonensis TaxID=101571 RepID=UPI000752F7DE|nr:acyltransferase [Burkholderia ubonensis]KVM71555.1 hypothetical protein WJ60_08525 [Burkholderia ubonensis]KVZ01741.1 hypothetical protein WL11_19105 [Burkholderia ubonensis]